MGSNLFLRVTLLAVLGLALGARGSDADRLPPWAAEAAAQPIPEAFADEDAIVLLDERTIRVRGGARKGVHRWLLKVRTEDGTEHGSFLVHAGAFRRFGDVKVWRVDPDGGVDFFDADEGRHYAVFERRLLDEDERLWVKPPGIRPGSMLALEYEFEADADLPQTQLWVQRRIPVRRMRVSVEAGDTWRVQSRVVGGENPGPAGPIRTGVWEFVDVPAFKHNDARHAPEPPLLTMMLEFVPEGGSPAFPDWNSTARWVAGLYEKSQEQTPEVDAAIAGLSNQGRDPVEAVGELVRAIRYFGIEIKWGGWRPRAPETTLRRGFGDCKDKSLLMVTLLRRLGIEAVPVLVQDPARGYVYGDLPGPFQFNHCIVGIPPNGSAKKQGLTIAESPGVGALRLFDPTFSGFAPPDVDPKYEGGWGLPVDDRAQGLLTIPRSSASHNRWVDRIDGRLEADGSLHMTLLRSLAGAMTEYMGDEERQFLKPAALLEKRLQEFAPYYPGLSDAAVGEPYRTPEGAWAYEFSFRQQDPLSSFGSLGVLRLHVLTGLGRFPLPDEDEPQTLYQPRLSTIRERLTFDVAGAELLATPEEVRVENSIGRVLLTVQRNGDRVVLLREAETSSIDVPPEKREEARALRQALRKVNGANLIVKTD